MFKKSIYIVLIQVLDIILGFVSVFLIAGDMDPEVYSVIGIYQIVCSISMVFTGMGLETVLARENLFWEKNGDIEKTKEYATQAFFSRFLSGAVVMSVMAIYLFVMNSTKYTGRYTVLFICMFIGAVFNYLIDSMRNIVRSGGGYVFVQIMGTLSTTILKLLGVFVYYFHGVSIYLFFYVLSPITILFCFFLKCRRLFSFKYVQVCSTLKKCWCVRYLYFRGILDYIRINADSLLVSILFPPALIGSYSIYKSLDQMMRNFVEGFFDVLSQNTVKYKGDMDNLCLQERKIKRARNFFVMLIIIGLFIYIPRMSWWVSIVNLSKYEGIELLILCVAIGGVLYLLGKYEMNAITFLGETKMIFKIAFIDAVIAVCSYGIVVISPTVDSMIIQRISVYALVSFVAVWLFKKNRTKIYSELNE